jgi:hypothetical protein
MKSLTTDELNTAHRGGQLIKILYLSNQPGMDEIAIKLNCGLTYDEERAAEKWFRAFALARDAERRLFEMAAELAEATER